MSIALKKLIVIISASLMMLCASAQSKYNKYGNSYNYQKALELLGDDEYEKAETAFTEEIKEHPKNGYAHMWLSIIYLYDEEYGKAISSANSAIKLIPKKDKEYYAFAFNNRARVYEQIDSTNMAIADYSTAISINPKDDDSYARRAQIYYQEELYDFADKDYQSLLLIDEQSVIAQMGLGRNELARKNYASALKYFDKIASLYSDYSSGFSFRAEAYIGLGKYKEAASDIVTALDIDADNKAFNLMLIVANSSFVHINTKLKAQAALSHNEGYWLYCLGVINEESKRYSEAISNYQKANKLDERDITYNRISKCYQLLYDWDSAIQNMDKAIELNPKDYRYLYFKAGIYKNAGKLKEAIAVMDNYIELQPDYYYAYYRRAWYKDNYKDIDGAIEDYSTYIELVPDYAYSYMSRGRQYLLKGEKDLANKDFEKAIQLDTIPEQGSCRMYALYHLGRNTEAIEWMDKMLKSSDEAGIRYEATCLYSLMGNTEKALHFFEEALKGGYLEYNHFIIDDDLDNIRDTEEYKALINKYFPAQKASSLPQDELVEYEEKVVEVPFSRQGGVTKVKCDINGLPLHFIFDTGAATVSLSSLEATFMYKNDYITSDDIVGSAAFKDANGDISIGTIINLRKVGFGGLELTNVRASVVANDKAPLLLGQSVLNRLGKIEIDYDRSVLTVTSRIRK